MSIDYQGVATGARTVYDLPESYFQTSPDPVLWQPTKGGRRPPPPATRRWALRAAITVFAILSVSSRRR